MISRDIRRKFGQNYLSDPAIIFEMGQAISPQTNSNFFEIGPGMGALTNVLNQDGISIKAVDIDKNAIERRFKELQRALHPDKFAYTQQEQPIPESSELEQNLDERALSAAASALVNKAYQTLREPVERLRYVLEEEGIAVLSESESSSN